MSPRRFRVAFSFAGEKRPYVEEVAALLAAKIGWQKILYDKYHEAEFARADLGTYLPKLYSEEADLVVPVLCPKYSTKRWTGSEWQHIYSLLTKEDSYRVMPTRFELASADGLTPGCGFIELDNKKPDEFVALIETRLKDNDLKEAGTVAPVLLPATPASSSAIQTVPNVGKRLVRYFISYAPEDEALSKQLIVALEFHFGICENFFFRSSVGDSLPIRHGFGEKVQRASQESDLGMLLVSPNYLAGVGSTQLNLTSILTGPRPCIPVILTPIDFDNHTLWGLKRDMAYLFRKNDTGKAKAFSQVPKKDRGEFVLDLFGKTNSRLKNYFNAGLGMP